MRATQKYLEVTFVSNACIFVSVCDCDCDCTQQSLDALWSRVRSPRERRAASSVAASLAATPALATCCRYICGSRCCWCCCCCHKRKTECMTNVRLARGCSSNEATAVAGVSSRYKIHGLPACVGLACLAVEQFIRLSIGWQVVGRPRLAFQTRRQISS